jgi:hypothetical protein
MGAMTPPKDPKPDPRPTLRAGKPLPLRQAMRRMHARYGKALERLAK